MRLRLEVEVNKVGEGYLNERSEGSFAQSPNEVLCTPPDSLDWKIPNS